MNHNLSIITLSFTLFAMFGTTAFAGKVKENHAGAVCVRSSGGAIRYDVNGSIANASERSTAYVICPIPHTDFDGYYSSGEIDGGWVRAMDKNDVRDIRCRFKSRGINNSGSYYSRSGSIGKTYGFGIVAQHINLKGVGEHWHSHYVLGCELPPRTHHGVSTLNTFQVKE